MRSKNHGSRPDRTARDTRNPPARKLDDERRARASQRAEEIGQDVKRALQDFARRNDEKLARLGKSIEDGQTLFVRIRTEMKTLRALVEQMKHEAAAIKSAVRGGQVPPRARSPGTASPRTSEGIQATWRDKNRPLE